MSIVAGQPKCSFRAIEFRLAFSPGTEILNALGVYPVTQCKTGQLQRLIFIIGLTGDPKP